MNPFIYKTFRSYTQQGIPLDAAATLTLAEMQWEKSGKGHIQVGYGNQTITINTPFTPSQVFVALEPEEVTVCTGDINTAGVAIVPTGFILYLSIKSNLCNVYWIARESEPGLLGTDLGQHE